MKQYKNGTKFEVCNHKELIKKGWYLKSPSFGKSKIYEHADYQEGGVITYNMIESYHGDTLTTIGQSVNFLKWYYVAENPHFWPVGTFLEDMNTKINPLWCIAPCVDAPCVEGQTAILGYIICKICGQNLRKIKVN